MAALIELPHGEDLWFVNAHLPPGGSPAMRQDRTETILSLWGGRPRTFAQPAWSRARFNKDGSPLTSTSSRACFSRR